MPLSSVQKGAIGQYAFLSTAMATGNGQIEAYTPAADNEGRDAEVRRHLKSSPGIGIQVKMTFFTAIEGGHDTYLTIRFSMPERKVQNDPRLWYFLGLYELRKPGLHDPGYLMRSDVFHRMARRGKSKGQVWFSMTANLAPGTHDRWSPYRVALGDLGKRLLQIIDETPLKATGAAPQFPVHGVWLSHPMRGGARLRTASVDRKYDLIRNAVLGRDSVSGWYHGHLRLFSPFLLGTRAGDPHVLGYQFGGTSDQPLRPEGDPKNWRCLRVAELTRINLLPGTWHAVKKGKGFQHCIDQVDVWADSPPPARPVLHRAA